MATNAKLGIGIEFRRGDGTSPEQFTKVPEVRVVPDFGIKNDQVEATTLDSINGKEYIPGLPDGIEFSIAVNYDNSQSAHTGLVADAKAGVTRNFQVYYPDDVGSSPDTGMLASFAANVNGYTFSGGPNEVRLLTVTCKITGGVSIETLT